MQEVEGKLNEYAPMYMISRIEDNLRSYQKIARAN